MDNQRLRAELHRKAGHVFFEIGTATLERLLADSDELAALRARIADAALIEVIQDHTGCGDSDAVHATAAVAKYLRNTTRAQGEGNG